MIFINRHCLFFTLHDVINTVTPGGAHHQLKKCAVIMGGVLCVLELCCGYCSNDTRRNFLFFHIIYDYCSHGDTHSIMT